MTTATTIEPDSLADRVCHWFAKGNNLGAERTAGALARQYDVARITMIKHLEDAVTTGLLIFTQGTDGMVYKAGPKLGAWMAASNAAHNLVGDTQQPAKAAPAGTGGGRRVRLPITDAHKLEIRKGVPPPDGRNMTEKGRTKWDYIFEALADVNDSTLLPRPYQQALLKASHVYGKRLGRKFVVRLVDDAQCGVWRVA